MTPAERQAAYRKRHPERCKAAVLKYQKKHRKRLNKLARLRARKRREIDPEGERKKQRAWYAANPLKRKAQQLWRYYRMPMAEYERLAKHQKHRCWLCRKKPNVLCVDHCHKTGRVRGLLCHTCNHLLHRKKDTIKFFSRIIEYLSSPPACSINLIAKGERNPTR